MLTVLEHHGYKLVPNTGLSLQHIFAACHKLKFVISIDMGSFSVPDSLGMRSAMYILTYYLVQWLQSGRWCR